MSKKQSKPSLLTLALFTLDYGFLISFLVLLMGQRFVAAWQTGLPFAVIAVSFLTGCLLGYACERMWRKTVGLQKELLTVLSVFLMSCFSAIMGLVLGATLGGNGYTFEFAGLVGYESMGLMIGALFAYFGTLLCVYAYYPDSQKTVYFLFDGLLLLILLLVGDAFKLPNLSSAAVIALPALTTVLRYGFKQ